ncbi:MAG: 50S ribosomal protein L35 [Oscillospiraceae bacterium]|nr:50S ribosomal protein L35 [Oscillospiraceae bacterium]
MPKIKTHSGAKKRFGLTKSGKVKRARAYKQHRLNNTVKGRPRHRRRLKRYGLVDKSNVKQIMRLIPYK